MQYRFIGDPVERLSGRFTNPPSDEWHDVPEGMESRYAYNSHYEVRESATPAPAKRRAKKSDPPQTDGWDDATDEGPVE